MKKIIFLISFSGLLSCQEPSKETNEETTQEGSNPNILEKVTILNPEKDSLHTPGEIVPSVMTKLDSLLAEPFDLYAFKLKKNGSLSGGANFKDYHYKPSLKGTGYRFFMFEPKTPNLIENGQAIRHQAVGYLGANKKNTSMKEQGLVITTFQPLDRFQHMFLNLNEVLIELTAHYNDFDLREMAFVGLDSLSIIKEFGKETFYRNSCLVYTANNNAFIQKIEDSKVAWIRYIRLAGKFENFTNDKSLFNLDGTQ